MHVYKPIFGNGSGLHWFKLLKSACLMMFGIVSVNWCMNIMVGLYIHVNPCRNRVLFLNCIHLFLTAHASQLSDYSGPRQINFYFLSKTQMTFYETVFSWVPSYVVVHQLLGSKCIWLYSHKMWCVEEMGMVEQFLWSSYANHTDLKMTNL